MAVYARCTKCGTRRDQTKSGGAECLDKSAHKGFVSWVARVQFSRRHAPMERSFPVKTCKGPQDLAIAQVRKWYTEHKEGTLDFKKKGEVVLFSQVIERYNTEHVLKYNRYPEHTATRLSFLDKLLGRFPVTSISLQQLKDLRDKVSTERHWKPSSTNRVFKSLLHAIFEKAREWELVDKNPVEFLKALPVEPSVPRFLTEAEIEMLRRASPSRVFDDYIVVLLHTGARPSSIEACSFDNDDVDFEHQIIWFTTYKGASGQKHRYPVPMDEQLSDLVTKRAELTGKKGPVFDTTNIRKLADKAIADSKINEGKAKNRWFTIYGLKHCFASHHLMKGASLHDIATHLGHTDDKMVRKHYAHLTDEHLRAMQARVNLTPELKTQLKII